jgi:hypothetical protein
MLNGLKETAIKDVGKFNVLELSYSGKMCDGWVWVIVVAASALVALPAFAEAAVVHCRRKVADAKPQQDEESVARDSAAETGTLTSQSSMKQQASDT